MVVKLPPSQIVVSVPKAAVIVFTVEFGEGFHELTNAPVVAFTAAAYKRVVPFTVVKLPPMYNLLPIFKSVFTILLQFALNELSTVLFDLI